MTLKKLFDICSMICDKHIAKNEKACVTYQEEQVRYTEIKSELEKVRDWCYNMNTSNLKQCTECKDCIHYKTMAKGTQVSQFCELDNQQKPPVHYCSFAKEKQS